MLHPAGSTLLVVDDEACLRNAIARLLQRAGYRCLEAPSAQEAIGVLDNTIFFYIVGDNGASAEGGPEGTYNEMMAHVAMMQHKKPKNALVIGGGDGYVLSEVLKHASIEHVDHVDLDGDVIEICKEHFSWGEAWNDSRVTLHIDDGAAFVARAATGFYDVIIQDSSDPWTWDDSGRQIDLPSSVLYGEKHFRNIHRALSDSGIFNFQVSSFGFD